MRRIVALLLTLAVIVGGLALVDHFVKDKVQSVIAGRIETDLPGSRATVQISSFPFLGRLALWGSVPAVHADVADVSAGHITFSSIRLTVDDLKVKRSDLFSGKVTPLSIKRGRVVAIIPASGITAVSRLGLRLGSGTVSRDGASAPVHATVDGSTVTFSVTGLPSWSLDVPPLSVLPCVSSARVEPGAVRLTCRFRSMPSVLRQSLQV